MARLAIAGFLLFLAIGPVWAAGDLRAIELTDGTTIVAEILSVDNGVYTLRSESLGEMKVPSSDIRVIRFPPSKNARPAPAREAPGMGTASGASGKPAHTRDHDSQVEDLKRSMAEDEDIMAIIRSLQDEPEVQAVLEDPELVQAIESNDLGTLMSDPKFMKLLNNPKIREIQRRSMADE